MQCWHVYIHGTQEEGGEVNAHQVVPIKDNCAILDSKLKFSSPRSESYTFVETKNAMKIGVHRGKFCAKLDCQKIELDRISNEPYCNVEILVL